MLAFLLLSGVFSSFGSSTKRNWPATVARDTSMSLKGIAETLSMGNMDACSCHRPPKKANTKDFFPDPFSTVIPSGVKLKKRLIAS